MKNDSVRVWRKSGWAWCTVGVSGNALVNKNADRLRSMNIWDYADGQDLYVNAMLVDLSQPPGEVAVAFVIFPLWMSHKLWVKKWNVAT